MIFQKDMHHALRRCRAVLLYRRLQQDSSRRGIILGIETSCDDTGAALIDLQGSFINSVFWIRNDLGRIRSRILLFRSFRIRIGPG
jgi:hypothetical protein